MQDQAKTPCKPLAGIKVLDFSTLLPGPLCSYMLAECGAEVVKIERPGGEEMRSYGPYLPDGQSAPYLLINRGKTSICVDLKDPSQRQALLDRVLEFDVIVEGFRPGVMERLGFSYETVRSRAPRIIYCSISGYGQSGPKQNRPGHDLTYMAEMGLLSLSHPPTAMPSAPLADIAGGTYPALVNILLALIARERTGSGCHLDVSITKNLLPLLYYPLADGFTSGDWQRCNNGPFWGGSPRYNLYPTKDGKVLAVAALEDRFWAAFCNAIGLAESGQSSAKEMIEVIAAIIAEKNADHWKRVINPDDCCCLIASTLGEALAEDEYQALIRPASSGLPLLPTPIANVFRYTVLEDMERV